MQGISTRKANEAHRRMNDNRKRNAQRSPSADIAQEPNFWEAMGLPAPRYEATEGGPDVDDDELRRLVRQHVGDDRADELFRLVYTYKAWREAYDRIAREELDTRS